MLLKFVNKCNIDAGGIHVFLHTGDKKSFETLLAKHKISSNSIGTKVQTPQGSAVFFQLDEKAMFYSTNKLAKQMSSYNNANICICLSTIDKKFKLLVLQLIVKHLYAFDKYKSDKSGSMKTLFIKDDAINKHLIQDIIHQINVTNINRDLQNEPANKMHPDLFCKHASDILGKNKHLKIQVLDDKELKAQGFNLIYEMGKGSVNKARFMIVKYIPNTTYKTVCMIGKTVCFDLGGADLKGSSSKLFQMKTDKAGGCTVVSLIKYIMDSGMKLNVIGLMPVIENMISGSSVLPGDIIKSYGGTTVEILNTDAEGRIIMADAFDYSNTLKNIDYIFDLATLTGAAEQYHCDTSCAYFTLNRDLKNHIETIAENVGDRLYSLPTWPEYMELTKSSIANVQNNNSSACPSSGAFMATMFLLNFVPKHLQNKWVHLDITHSYTGHLANGNATLLMINLLKQLVVP